MAQRQDAAHAALDLFWLPDLEEVGSGAADCAKGVLSFANLANFAHPDL